jgi:hypothetical protein
MIGLMRLLLPKRDTKQKLAPSYFVNAYEILKVGDIVTEVELIVPDDRSRWNGLVVNVQKNAWVFTTLDHPDTQDKVTILWLDTGIMEDLPVSVVVLLYRAEEG